MTSSVVELRSDSSLFRSRLATFLSSSGFCDLNLILVDTLGNVQQCVKAHCVVLAASSPFFERLIREKVKMETSTETFMHELIVEANPIVFDHVLNLAYCGETIVEESLCQQVNNLLLQYQFQVDSSLTSNNADTDAPPLKNEVSPVQCPDDDRGQIDCAMTRKPRVRRRRRQFEEQIVMTVSQKCVKECGGRRLNDELTYLCTMCGKNVKGLTNYRRHQYTHTGTRPFKCDTCGKAFTQSHRLKTHMRTHTGEKPFLCFLCGRAFNESCKLKRHLERVHKTKSEISS